MIYDDRLEILSPGDLPGIITLKNMKEKRYARNPIISRTLTELGVVKELNEGVSRIYREMQEFFLEEPVYEESKGYSVKLTLKNNIVMRSKRKNETLLKDSKISSKWEELNAMERKMLQYIADKGQANIVELSSYLSRSESTVRRLLKNLENYDLIYWYGSNKYDPKKVYKIR